MLNNNYPLHHVVDSVLPKTKFQVIFILCIIKVLSITNKLFCCMLYRFDI